MTALMTPIETTTRNENLRKNLEETFENIVGNFLEKDRVVMFDLCADLANNRADKTELIYSSLCELLESVCGREFSAHQEIPLTDYAIEVRDADDPLGHAFAILRRNPDLDKNDVRSILEQACPGALKHLDCQTRSEVFDWVWRYRNGADNVDVANVYVDMADILVDIELAVA